MKYILVLSGLFFNGFLLAQNVGIGTTTPSFRLHVVDSSASSVAMIQAPVGGDRAELRLMADMNPFNYLSIQKYFPGASGTFGGIPKDNLSVINTSGNAGTLLIGTGDGVSPLVFFTGTGERMRITADGKAGLGTATPAIANNLHVHSNDASTGNDVSIGITNTTTTDGGLRGARLRMLGSDFIIYNYEATGKLHFNTGFNNRLTIDAAGKVGIGTSGPNHKLDIAASGSGIQGVHLAHTGTNTEGVMALMTGTTNLTAMIGTTLENTSGSNYGIGVRGSSGAGGTFLNAATNYGVVGESLNTSEGTGVFGGSNAGSASMTDAGVIGLNWSTGANVYGVIGKASGTSGAGTAGVTDNAGSAGIYGLSNINGGTAVRAEIGFGITSGTALEVKNGSIKVTGASKPVFQITATTGLGGNTVGNTLIIPNTAQANDPADLLIVTPVFAILGGVYLNKPIGVWWNGSNWTIFTQDLSAMPNGAVFNVLVVKQ